MKLDIFERITLLDMLAGHRGMIITLKVVQKLMDKVGFTEDENEDYQLKYADNGGVFWRAKEGVEVEKDFELSEKQIRFVKQLMEKNPNLGIKHLSLLEKFGVKIPDEEE